MSRNGEVTEPLITCPAAPLLKGCIVRSVRAVVAVVAVTITAVMLASPAAYGAKDGAWRSWGFDASNTRHNSTESTIGVGNVSRLVPKWRLATAGDVSATPAVEDGVVYVPDYAGNLYAVDAANGTIKWQASIAAMTGITGDFARSTPAIWGDVLVLGDQAGKLLSPDGYVMGIDKRTGQLLWRTTVEGGYPLMTQSPTIVNGVAYIGAASFEEALALFGYPLDFRGFLMAVDVATGSVKWKTDTVPDGYTGGAVWGSSPAVDAKRGSVYIATGNNYSVPDAVVTCVSEATDDAGRAACMDPANLFDSIVSLNLATGAVKWSTRALPTDFWNLNCGVPGFPPFDQPNADCPPGAGPDHDFAQAPALYKVRGVEFLGAGQKSGTYWALDPPTGAVRWQTQVGPGGYNGGLQWGSAIDATRIYTAEANSDSKPWELQDGSTVEYGGWSALDPGTGRILWQRPNPAEGIASGPVSVANGVMYACSADADGHMYALKATDGTVLWDFASGDRCYAGAAISDGTVYWGTGYTIAGYPDTDPDQALYAFGLPSKPAR